MAKLTSYRSLQHGDVATVDDSAQIELGARALDTDGNEYVYLEGVASVAAGDFVTYDSAYKAVRLVADAVGPVAVAKAAIVADKFGWFQIRGLVAGANVATATTANAALYASATAGRAAVAKIAGDLVIGARADGNSASNVGNAFISYPFVTNDAGTGA